MLIQELTRQESLDLLARTRFGRLACAQGTQPYVVPVYFSYHHNYLYRGPRIIAVAGNRGHPWGEQYRIETRTKRNHSWVNSGCLTIGGNYSRSPIVFPRSGKRSIGCAPTRWSASKRTRW